MGSYGIAVTHANQIVVLSLTDGAVLAKKNTDAMRIARLMPFGKNRVFVGFRSWDWYGRRAAELTLPDGELHAVPDLDDLDRATPNYWVSGSKPPFTLHRANQLPAEMPLDPSCMPIDAHFCSWREIPGRTVHVMDVQHGKWQHFDAGKMLEGTDSVDVVPAGLALFGVICGRSSADYPFLRLCVVRDLETERDLYKFQGNRFRAVGSDTGDKTPEIRLVVYAGDAARTISVSQDGHPYTWTASEAAWLGAPGSDLGRVRKTHFRVVTPTRLRPLPLRQPHAMMLSMQRSQWELCKLRCASGNRGAEAVLRGERAAAIYSVIETAKLNGIEPQAYIADVIEKIAGDWPATRWDELMPWNWQPTQQDVAQAA